MKKKFQNRMEAIDWISSFANNEGQFEVLREQLTFSYIYFKSYFLNIVQKENLAEVVLLRNK